MKSWSRLILPLGLGALAAILNASAMKARLVPIELVSINRTIKAGEKIKEADLEKVLVNYPSKHLSKHFWLWKKRSQLLNSIGTPVPLSKGQLVSKTDYANLGRNLFSIPRNFALIGVRCSEDAITDRRRVIPGRSIRLKYGSDESNNFKVLFVEPIEGKNKKEKVYQIGVLVPTDKSDRGISIETILSSRPTQIVGA